MNRPETLAQTPPGPTDFPRGEIKKNPRKMSLSDDSCEHEDTVSEWEMVRGKSTNIWAGIQIYSHPYFEIQHCNIRALAGRVEGSCWFDRGGGRVIIMFTAGSITPPPPPILKPSIVMTAPRCPAPDSPFRRLPPMGVSEPLTKCLRWGRRKSGQYHNTTQTSEFWPI